MSWPADVEQYYADLAASRDWSPDTVAAIRATVELVRDLDLGTAPRTYGVRSDDDGAIWMFQAVWHEGEWVVVRQLEAAPGRPATRYWWQRIEDDNGMLADKALDREAWGLVDLDRDAFYAAWDDPAWPA
jgi:hypothetical protein